MRTGSKLDLYFNVDKDVFNYTSMFERLSVHPMVANVEYLPAKSEGQWKANARGIWNYFPDDHLSPGDIGVRTTNNLGVKAGYTKHKDGKPFN